MNSCVRLLCVALAVLLASCASHQPSQRVLPYPYQQVRAELESLKRVDRSNDGWVEFRSDRPNFCKVRLFGPATISHFENNITIQPAEGNRTLATASTDFDLFWLHLAAPGTEERARKHVEEHFLDVLNDAVQSRREFRFYWTDLWVIPWL